MRKVRVVILDSGVKKSHKRFNEDQIQGYTLYKEGVSPDFEDTYGMVLPYTILSEKLKILPTLPI